jgi:hypothetical protein
MKNTDDLQWFCFVPIDHQFLRIGCPYQKIDPGALGSGLNRAEHWLTLAAWCNRGASLQRGILKFDADLPEHHRQSVSLQVAQKRRGRLVVLRKIYTAAGSSRYS